LGNRSENPGAEMNFLDHLEDLRWHIIRSFIALVICAIVAFVNIEWIFDTIILGPAHDTFVSYKWFCALGNFFHVNAFCLNKVNMSFQNTAVAGQFMMSLSVSMMVGFIVAFPYIFWEFWRFVKPALKDEEKKYARGIVFWCSLLFFTGVLFSYYVVVPYTINFFGNYKLSPMIPNIVKMDDYYDTVSTLIVAMGAVFELPVIMFFLTRIGLISPAFLRKQRRYAILILFIIAEIITPPDLFSCLLVFIPLYALFEISILISARAVRD
jgi:sec-independent protein translocase protein TatC